MDAGFTRRELDRASDLCNVKSTPGVNQISYLMIRDLLEEVKNTLVDCINDIRKRGIQHREWKEALIIRNRETPCGSRQSPPNFPDIYYL